jgi:hypothetical protein
MIAHERECTLERVPDRWEPIAPCSCVPRVVWDRLADVWLPTLIAVVALGVHL